MQSKQKVVVIAGPTGSGESTITERLVSLVPGSVRLVTATTRRPREGEVNGEAYVFMEKDDFESKIRDGEILEHTYIKSRGVYYGTYKPVLEKALLQHRAVFVNPDSVGMRFFRDAYGALTIFIHPGSFSELEKRIRLRNPGMHEEELQKRLIQAKKELNEESPEYTYHVVNADGKLEDAVQGVLAILKKEGYSTNDE